MTVKEIKIGWKKLQTDLEILRTAINHNQPLRGDGILINETDTGCVISAAKPGADGGDGGPGGWQQIYVVDTNCNTYTLNVWADSSGAQPVL